MVRRSFSEGGSNCFYLVRSLTVFRLALGGCLLQRYCICPEPSLRSGFGQFSAAQKTGGAVGAPSLWSGIANIIIYTKESIEH